MVSFSKQHIYAAGALYVGTVACTYVYFKSQKDNHVPIANSSGQSSFDSLAQVYDSKIGSEERLLGYGLLRWWMLRQAQGDVLEISAGTGRNFKYYNYSKIKALTVCDVSKSMLDVAEAKYYDELHINFKHPQHSALFCLSDAHCLCRCDGISESSTSEHLEAEPEVSLSGPSRLDWWWSRLPTIRRQAHAPMPIDSENSPPGPTRKDLVPSSGNMPNNTCGSNSSSSSRNTSSSNGNGNHHNSTSTSISNSSKDSSSNNIRATSSSNDNQHKENSQHSSSSSSRHTNGSTSSSHSDHHNHISGITNRGVADPNSCSSQQPLTLQAELLTRTADHPADPSAASSGNPNSARISSDQDRTPAVHTSWFPYSRLWRSSSASSSAVQESSVEVEYTRGRLQGTHEEGNAVVQGPCSCCGSPVSEGNNEVADTSEERCRRLSLLSGEPLYQFDEHSFDTVVDTFGLCSHQDPVRVLRQAVKVCRPGGTIILLEHGRSSWDYLNKQLDSSAAKHYSKWGCWWNRDILDICEQAGLQIDSVSRWHFGTTYMIKARPVVRDEQCSW